MVSAPTNPKIRKVDYERQYSYIQDNSFRAVITPCFVAKTEVLGDLITKDDISPLLREIIKCESGGNPIAKNPSSTARGLLQIIQTSELACEKALGKQLDMYNPQDNLECGRWLMDYGGGLKNWEETKNCWDK